MKLVLAHLSDSHFDEQDRLDETVEIHREILALSREAGVQLFLHAGDFFHRRSTPAERTALAEFLQGASAIAPFVGAKGNHDQAGDLEVFNRLDRDHPIRIFDRPTVMPGSAFPAGGQASVLALPWFDRAHLVAQLSAEQDGETTRLATIDAAKKMLALLRLEAEAVHLQGRTPLLVGHVMVAGSETGHGFIPIGTSVELSPYDIAEVGCAYAALGHVHMPQVWCDGRVAYSGSPRRCNFGEPEQKGFRIVTLEGDVSAPDIDNRFVPLESARKIYLLENFWTGHGWSIPLGNDAPPPNSLVRFRYRIKPEQLHEVDEQDLRRFYLEACRAYEVKIEAVLIHEQRIRSAEIVTAESTWEKVQACWSAKQIDPDPETRARVRQKLDLIEAGQREQVAA